MKNQALLLFLLALTTTYVECLPIETEAVKESNEIVEERRIVYDPTVDTGKFKNWDEYSFMHTKCCCPLYRFHNKNWRYNLLHKELPRAIG